MPLSCTPLLEPTLGGLNSDALAAESKVPPGARRRIQSSHLMSTKTMPRAAAVEVIALRAQEFI